MNHFTFGPKSMREREGVHPLLLEIADIALRASVQDFTFFEGLRTYSEQQGMVATGASKTMLSKHLMQEDGYSHAMDLVPYLNGRNRWEWPLIYPVASAVQDAAIQLGVPIRWGGVWDRRLNDLPKGAIGLERAVTDYVDRRRNAGKKAFIDGPHYELIV